MLREVKDSKLLGRGGAAFPMGVKWEAVARQPARPHYLICNADESEPGTFKDRAIIEGDPFSLIEAMTIAAYATNTAHGYVYLRGEYPDAHHVLGEALQQARLRGFLGEDILGEGFAFDIEIRKGAGAYICGEETAIFNSIEGYRGEPRNKPPFPVVSGLFAKPTVVNNVETLVNVLDVVTGGGPGFASIGTEDSTGHQAVLPLGRCRAAGDVRGRVRHDAARTARSRRRRAPAATRCRRCCSAERPAVSCAPTSSTCRSRSRTRARPARRSARASCW